MSPIRGIRSGHFDMVYKTLPAAHGKTRIRGASRAVRAGDLKAALRIMAATGVFAAVHSGLASRTAKHIAANQCGQRNRDGLYRVAYIGQSITNFAMLTAYIRSQPGTQLYQVTGKLAWALRGAQLASLAVATQAASEVGLSRISGLDSFLQWLRQQSVDAEPEAQGPSLKDGALYIAGPFKWSRHPLNFWPLPVLWLNPRMTTNMLAFNVAASVYLVVGSVHEESRLRAAYGESYVGYERSGAPFYIPFLSKLFSRS